LKKLSVIRVTVAGLAQLGWLAFNLRWSWLVKYLVAVEKLPRAKLAKTKLRYDALQTTFLIF
jgi:hypothetical protein